MRLILLVLLGFFTSGFSYSFEDEELGLNMEIPDSVQPSWFVYNRDTGLEINLFCSDSEDDQYVVAFAKMPIEEPIEDNWEMLAPFFLKQIEDAYYRSFYINHSGIVLQAHQQASLSADPLCGQRVRFYLTKEDFDAELFADVHFFYKEGMACVILTGMYPDAFEEQLDAFSHTVVSTVQFN